MAVHFEFILDDVDASNLIMILNDAKVEAQVTASEYSLDKTKVGRANADWYKGYAEYLGNLLQKVSQGGKKI